MNSSESLSTRDVLVEDNNQNRSPERVPLLLTRAVEQAGEMDKEDLASLNPKDFADDDVDILENYFAYMNGDKSTLTEKKICEYVNARDRARIKNPDNPNTRIKYAIAKFILKGTSETWLIA